MSMKYNFRRDQYEYHPPANRYQVVVVESMMHACEYIINNSIIKTIM
jgi:hypothetical protein